MKITEALTAEHKVLCALFSQIEGQLPGLNSLPEIQLATRLVEGALTHHAKAEEDLLFSAFDHLLEHKSLRTRFFQEHREIHTSLKTVKIAEQVVRARELLKIALTVSREHFSREESLLFPQVEQAMSPETLNALGKAWFQHPSCSCS